MSLAIDPGACLQHTDADSDAAFAFLLPAVSPAHAVSLPVCLALKLDLVGVWLMALGIGS